jgi:hypothetical protein
MTRLISAVSALAFAALTAAPVAAQTYAIRFQNYSGGTVYRIYSSPSNNGSWEQDLLGANVLYPGQGLDVVIHNVSNCYYDVLVEFQSGYSFTDTWNICSFSQYNIN